MAIPNPVQAGDALARGVNNRFHDTYRSRYKGLSNTLGLVMDMEVPSDKETELYEYPESAPRPKRQDRGAGISSDIYRYVSFSVTNKAFATRVSWHRDDLRFDQTGRFRADADRAGAKMAILKERLFFQVLTADLSASAVAELLASIPNAPDGAALFSTTDGSGANRFGVSGGNIVTGSGVATSQDIRTDFFAAVNRMLRFQDTKGDPLHDPGIADQMIVIIAGETNREVFSEAFNQGRTLQTSTVATGDSVGAAVSNVIMDSGHKVKLILTQRITDNDWTVHLAGDPLKAVFAQNASALETEIATASNSDLARDLQVESTTWRQLLGIGVNVPLNASQVNN